MGEAEELLGSCARMALTRQEPMRRERRWIASGVDGELLVSGAILGARDA